MSILITDVISISSGTLSCLTGYQDYKTLESIHQNFVLFCAGDGKEYKNWMEAWNKFWN
jgi:hypothetical protein